jgi:hypothetical protein
VPDNVLRLVVSFMEIFQSKQLICMPLKRSYLKWINTFKIHKLSTWFSN